MHTLTCRYRPHYLLLASNQKSPKMTYSKDRETINKRGGHVD